MRTHTCSITLAGPVGAGKTTVGTLVAKRLGIAFVDLDRRFADRAQDVSAYITRFGYDDYARENVRLYRSLLDEGTNRCVIALSSGFMTYARNIHDEYASIRNAVEQSPTTFILIPLSTGSVALPRRCVGSVRVLLRVLLLGKKQ